MSSIAEIEQAVAKLSAREFSEFERWFDEERNRKWDEQIEADSAGCSRFFVKGSRGRHRPEGERPRDEFEVT
jgi:hypothetical protein